MTNWVQHVELDLSGFQVFQQRVGERPSVRGAMEAKGLFEEGLRPMFTVRPERSLR